MKKILAIDSTWLTRRIFHATNKAVVKDIDEQGNEYEYQDKKIVITGTLQSILKKVKDLNYEYETVCLFDRGSWKYRPKEKFKDYKADRIYDDTFQCCWDATNDLIELLPKIGIKTIQIPGLEADDLGMYFSHLPNEVILYTVDSDWKQSLTENTIIHTTNKIITINDVINDVIQSPFDIAISKAINANGHDNLKTVLVEDRYLEGIAAPDKHSKIIIAYKQRALPQEILDAIDLNMHLSRLDKVLSDEPTIKLIESAYNRPLNVTNFSTAISLSQVLPDYPQYFNGVLGKYNSIHNKR